MGDPRPFTAGDIPRVAQIERSIFSDPWSAAAFAEALRQPHVRSLVLEDGEGGVIGYGLGSIVGDEAEILNLAIDPARRRRGAGRRLLDALLALLRAEGAGRFYLEVRRSNAAAIGLYEAAGFRPMGVRPAYYTRPREDALTMILEPASPTARK